MPAIHRDAPDWPKKKSGIRPQFPRMPAAFPLIIKWNALYYATMLYGEQIGDLWKQKRPKLTVNKVDREVKLKAAVLDNTPNEFPNLRHPAGCSLQYLIMLAEILGGSSWYEEYIRRPDEADIKSDISEEQIDSLLTKLGKPNGNNLPRVPS